MEVSESGISFEFPEGTSVQKFDDSCFYRGLFTALPYAKGVDFISNNRDTFSMIEVKNCRGDEGNNRWRIAPNNQKRDTTHTEHNVEDRDSLDIEVAEKVTMTLAALLGAGTFQDKKETAKELADFYQVLMSDGVAKDKKKILVVLFLEGNFATKTRNEKMILKELQDSLQKKLRWLNCRVSVVNSNTYKKGPFDSARVV